LTDKDAYDAASAWSGIELDVFGMMRSTAFICGLTP
jgi:hypothetical protein